MVIKNDHLANLWRIIETILEMKGKKRDSKHCKAS
jgi:hypothetical protein